MSWQIEMPIIVRTLINDVADQPVYSDERLQQIIAVAAKYVQLDLISDKTYAIDVVNLTITPDPTQNDDETFSGLVSLKAACLVDQSSLRTKAAMDGIRASLGPASLSVGGSLEGLKIMLNQGPCALYSVLVNEHNIGNASSIKAILSPFVGNNFDPRSINTYTDNRSRDFYR
jgi:hypothetical protein